MYEIDLTAEARDDLKALRKADQVTVVSALDDQLTHRPTQETRNRKKLRPNPIAEWDLRIGQFRAFYNVDEEAQTVSIEAIGFKVGNVLFIRNERREL